MVSLLVVCTRRRVSWPSLWLLLVRQLSLLLILCLGQFTVAQGQGRDESSLRQEQQRLFDRLQAQPDDLDAMFAYSVVSIELRDYEQAIATLERMLIYRDNLPRVKLELGSAYFRLGSYEVAGFYFNEVLDSDAPPEIRAKVEEFVAEINRRTKKNALTGVASFGILYSTNANLGPSERGIDVFGVDAELDPKFVKDDDVGFRASVRGVHTLDLELPNNDAWISEGTFAALRYLNEGGGDLDALILKTGPRLSLTVESYGPKIRPFAEGSYIRSGGEFLYLSAGGGADFLNTVNADTSVFATLGARYRDYTADRNENDGVVVYSEIGAQHRLEGGTVVRGSAFGVLEDTNADFASNYLIGGRVSVAYNYVPQLEVTRGQPWTVIGFGQVGHRWYRDPDPAVNPDKTRNDLDVRIGLSHIFRLPDGWALSIEGSYFDRSSNIRNFQLDNLEFGAFISKAF